MRCFLYLARLFFSGISFIHSWHRKIYITKKNSKVEPERKGSTSRLPGCGIWAVFALGLMDGPTYGEMEVGRWMGFLGTVG